MYNDSLHAPSWGIAFNTTEDSTEVALNVSEFKPMGRKSHEMELEMSNVTVISVKLMKLEKPDGEHHD